MEKKLIPFGFSISRFDIEKEQHHRGCVLWIIGLSGSGKSTLANKIQQEFFKKNIFVKILDGDSIRQGLCANLGFSEDDRFENLRRVAHTAKLFAEHGIITICSFISPLKKNRATAREILGDDYIEVFLDIPLEICEKRDPKGLYKKAREGLIKDFTGISSPFEKPTNSHLVLNSNLEAMSNEVISFLVKNGFIKSKREFQNWQSFTEGA